jgi:hypothetical protein
MPVSETAAVDVEGTTVSAFGEQTFTIIGVVVGAGMSYLAGFLNERARSNRDKASKLDEHRLSAYAAYGQAVKAMSSVASRIAAARGLNALMRPLEPDIGLLELDRIATDREIKWPLGSHPRQGPAPDHSRVAGHGRHATARPSVKSGHGNTIGMTCMVRRVHLGN